MHTTVADMNEPETIVWQERYITTKTRGRWEFVSRARGIRAAVIIAIDDERHILLVEQFRVPLGRPCIELPAGLIGDHDGQEDEDTLDAANRELVEDTGLGSRAARSVKATVTGMPLTAPAARSSTLAELSHGAMR